VRACVVKAPRQPGPERKTDQDSRSGTAEPGPIVADMNISLSHCFNSVRDSDEALKLDCAFRHPSGNSTPDLAGTFDRVQATGADVVQEPMDQSYGRDCAFRDPAGNMIRIIQTRG
jgi:uncharacterized glyoxalase superfamily protein PhnB